MTHATPCPLACAGWFSRMVANASPPFPLTGLLLVLWMSDLNGWTAPVTNSFVVRTNYYVVSGGTRAELYASILRSRPIKDGAPYDAKTEWNTSYTFRYQRAAAGCAPTIFELKTMVVMTLPLWQPSKDMPPELAKTWWTYVRALTTHEQGHVRLARETAVEAARRLRGLGTFPSSEALTLAAQQAFEASLDDGRANERRYDQETRHGAIQGAVFPFAEPPPRPLGASPAGVPAQK